MKVVGGFISLVGVMLLASASFAATCPESVPAPHYQVGDKFLWQYNSGEEKTWEVAGVEGNLAQVAWIDKGMRWTYDNAGTYFLDQDWVIKKGINKRGSEVFSPNLGAFALLGRKVLDFPLHLGKAWEVSYSSPNLSGSAGQNSAGATDTYYLNLKVVACEEVKTRAGTFEALKIEGRLTNSTRSGWGVFYEWYSPKAKNIVKREYGQSYPPAWWMSFAQDYELTKLDLR